MKDLQLELSLFNQYFWVSNCKQRANGPKIASLKGTTTPCWICCKIVLVVVLRHLLTREVAKSHVVHLRYNIDTMNTHGLGGVCILRTETQLEPLFSTRHTSRDKLRFRRWGGNGWNWICIAIVSQTKQALLIKRVEIKRVIFCLVFLFLNGSIVDPQ